MQLFLRQRDLDLFNTIAHTLVETIIETPIQLYKLAVSSMGDDDLYGDMLNKIYFAPVTLYALIAHDPEIAEYGEMGIDVNQNIVLNFQREILRAQNVYPEIGDIVLWNGQYYEIHNYNENTLAAGQQDQNWNYTIVCNAHMTRKSKIQIQEFRAGDAQ